ncbi:MAG: penicillin-binding protein 1C [Bacteroidota bacterium]|nr:penicillin-binding protein 1C [Bacteroidota bacterium]
MYNKIFTTIVVISAGFLSFLLLNLLFPLPEQKSYSLVIYDRNNTMLNAFRTTDGMWRIRTRPEEIPIRLKEILLWKEDRYFYYHFGVNPLSLARAVAQNLYNKKRISGASTITMQVARMLEPKERTYGNKIIEIFRALQLEWQYSKDEILAMYLSTVPLGGNIEGLQTAAMIYYQTPLERLNVAQIVDLILVPNDPNDLRPDRNSEILYQERMLTVQRFARSGIFSEKDYVILEKSRTSVTRNVLPKLAPHFSLRIKELYRSEDEIHSSLDLKIQQSAEKLLQNHMRIWKQREVNNGAVIVIDNATMEVAAYVGSENFSDSLHGSQVDAVRAIRSPGSTLKPFLYAQQMDNGTITPKSRLLDIPYDDEGFVAENYDKSFSGFVYADDALRRSLNVPMVYLLRDASVPEFVSFLTSAGIHSLESQKTRVGLSMILGGCGVTLEELTRAYAMFPGGGVFRMPSYKKVSQNISFNPQRVFSPSAAFMVTNILSGLDRPDLPNNFESAKNLPKVAFKTGTSYGKRDAWCIGYSSEYTIGVWIGNVTNKGNPELSGNKSATPLLIDIFNFISSSKKKSILPMPNDVQYREVCAVSGKIPTDVCSDRIDDLYSITHSLNVFCDIDKEFTVAQNGKMCFCPSCVERHSYTTKIFRDFPPALVNFWKRTDHRYSTPPPHNPECSRLFVGTGPKIITPSERMTYLIVSDNQKISLQASSGVDVKSHLWYLNQHYLGRKKVGETVFLTLHAGLYTARCIDDKGRSSSVNFTVKKIM